MAKSDVTIFVNGFSEENHVRTFGGNNSDVGEMADLYHNMSKEEFLSRHPKFSEMCKDRFKLYVCYHKHRG